MTFGQRLKQERKRLGMTQPDFAQIGKVEKNTQINYEQDKRFPTADYLLAVANIGVDTQFVLHGTPSVDLLTDDEKELLIGYRSLDIRGKARVLGIIEGAAPMDSQVPRTKISIDGSVGQQITGDVHGTVQGPTMGKTIVKKK